MVRTGERGDFLQKVPPLPRTPSPLQKLLSGRTTGNCCHGRASPARWSPGRVCGERHFFLIFSARWRTCHVKHARIRPNSSPLVIRFLLFAMLPGDRRTRDGLRDRTAYDPPGKVFCGMDGGAGGRDSIKKKNSTGCPLSSFCHAAGRLAGQGTACETRRPTILPAKFFAGWMGGAGGRESIKKKKQYEMPAFFFLPCCRETGEQGTALRDRTAYDPPGKVFCGMDGGAGGRDSIKKKNSTRCPLSSFCHAAGRLANKGRPARPDGLRSSRQSFFAGWMGGAGGRDSIKKKNSTRCPLSSFCHAAGRLADKGRPARPDGLRSSRQSFLRDGWGARGEETAIKRENSTRCPLSSFCHAAGRLADKGRPARPDGLRSSRQSFLRDGWGARGEGRGAFFQKSPLPSPRIHPRSLLIVFAFFHERIRALVAVRAQHCQGFVPREDATRGSGGVADGFPGSSRVGRNWGRRRGRGRARLPGTDAAFAGPGAGSRAGRYGSSVWRTSPAGHGRSCR